MGHNHISVIISITVSDLFSPRTPAPFGGGVAPTDPLGGCGMCGWSVRGGDSTLEDAGSILEPISGMELSKYRRDLTDNK